MSADMPSVSPEEKLLRLIRREKGPQASTAQPKIPASANRKQTLHFNPVRFSLDSTQLLQLFKVIVVLACIALAVVMLLPAQRMPTRDEISPVSAQLSAPTIQPYSYYTSTIGAREIFSTEQAAKVEAAPAIDINKVKERLSLMGIVSSDGSPQAIIEDKSAQKTYYLRLKESFDGITVIELNESAGKVTLEYQGIEFTIYL
jgi:type II secretory pathway component PulC